MMIATYEDLQPLARSDLVIGRPLPFPIFDRSGDLLLAAGQAVQSEMQLQLLCTRGLYRNPRWHPAVSVPGLRAVRRVEGAVDPDGDVAVTRQIRAATDDALGIQSLKMVSESGTHEYAVRLLGVNPDTSLIVTAPTEDGKLIFVKEGQSFKFQGFFGQSILTFNATIVKVQFAPFPYIHLSWPDAARIKRRHVRQARRAHCKQPCVIYFKRGGNDKQVHGFVINLSVGGAEVVVPNDAPDLSEHLTLAFRIVVDGKRLLVEAGGRIVRGQPEVRADGTHYGIGFADMTDELKLAIHAYIHELLVAQLECPLHV